MKMSRAEFLDKLEETVLNEQLLQCEYYGYIDGKKCFCVLGHAYNILGKGNLLDVMNRDEVGKIYGTLDSSLLINDYCGLSIKEFSNLQSLNDGAYPDTSKENVLNYIKELKEKEG